jgi:hypothetical protein
LKSSRGLPLDSAAIHWDRKLDREIAGSLMSIPAVKGVEIGLGFDAARRPGSKVHDPIAADEKDARDPRGGFRRLSNNAGGLEGGMTTGEPLVVRVAMKPISTLMSPLKTVDLASGAEANAQSERSDVTAVPAMGVIAEALTALVLADAMLEKFGGDSLAEMRRTYRIYRGDGHRWREVEVDDGRTQSSSTAGRREVHAVPPRASLVSASDLDTGRGRRTTIPVIPPSDGEAAWRAGRDALARATQPPR